MNIPYKFPNLYFLDCKSTNQNTIIEKIIIVAKIFISNKMIYKLLIESVRPLYIRAWVAWKILNIKNI